MTARAVRVTSRTSVVLGAAAIAIQAVTYASVRESAIVAVAVYILAAIAVAAGLDIQFRLHEPSGRHHRKPRARVDPARPDAGPAARPGPKGTVPVSPPAPGAVPPHPRYGDLHHTPPGGITALVGEHGIRVGGRPINGRNLGTQPRRQPWYSEVRP